MSNKNVLIIGASGGLGEYITKELAAAGYNLALHYNNGFKKLEAVFESIKEQDIKHKIYKADITSENEITEMIRKIKEDFGTIDILINNAGISINGMSWKLSADDWNKVIAVNLTGPFLCTKHVLPVMKENKFGRIIFMSSVVPQIGVIGTSAYAATKAGLGGLSKTISKEVIKNNITSNLISLGYFDAGLLYQIPEDIRGHIKETIPLKEFGNPLDVVECIKFICSRNSGYLTGQTINLNGGLF
ncbi:MAG: SDR family oxidoreductase [Ignavibacteria bacterium]|nr:SDR family oxidoreductase [Ignavibacteria bacterium]